MKILYGVVGEGMGHAIRSRVIIDHLINVEGHRVQVLASGRAYSLLADLFPEVHEIWGMTFTYRDNEISMGRSLVDLLKGGMKTGWPENISRCFEVTDTFGPQCVITDFESLSYLYGKNHQLPILGVDNIHMVARCRHPEEFRKVHAKQYQLTKNLVKIKTARSTHYYIPTFFYPEVRKPRTTLVPPVLRPEILQAAVSQDEHILVYLNQPTCPELQQVLSAVDAPFVVYGFKKDLTEPTTEDNVTYKPFDEEGFVHDLASSRAVIANGGFTLMSEAVYLRKPVLCVPIPSQFEQIMNGYYLEQLGYGFTMDFLDDKVLEHFFERLGSYTEALQGYSQPEGNGKLLTMLDERLDRIAAGVDWP